MLVGQRGIDEAAGLERERRRVQRLGQRRRDDGAQHAAGVLGPSEHGLNIKSCGLENIRAPTVGTVGDEGKLDGARPAKRAIPIVSNVLLGACRGRLDAPREHGHGMVGRLARRGRADRFVCVLAGRPPGSKRPPAGPGRGVPGSYRLLVPAAALAPRWCRPSVTRAAPGSAWSSRTDLLEGLDVPQRR